MVIASADPQRKSLELRFSSKRSIPGTIAHRSALVALAVSCMGPICGQPLLDQVCDPDLHRGYEAVGGEGHGPRDSMCWKLRSQVF